MGELSPKTSSGEPRLARVLGLWELVVYGVILIQPTAPMPLYGVVSVKAGGHVVTTVLIGMVAMLFTAVSYGRMARAYPSAGSAYTYVGRELNAAMGYLTGWGMLFDYVVNPIICVIWCSKAALNFVPEIPYAVWAVFFAVLFTGFNLRGIKTSARTNAGVAAGLGVVVLLFLAAAVRFVWTEPGLSGASFLRPFYDPQTFSWSTLSSGTALAVLTYIGFDGISTLSEEVENPRRNILLGTVLVCLLIGIVSAVEVYAAQVVWQAPGGFKDADTAFVEVAGKAGGHWLFLTVNLGLLVANMGSGMGAHMGAGRLLYGMGRDNAIPRRFFGVVNPRTRIPSNNIWLVGGVVVVGAFVLPLVATLLLLCNGAGSAKVVLGDFMRGQGGYELGAELLNFGAVIAFMGVNAAAFVRYYLRSQSRNLSNLLPPVLGFVICAYIWLSLGIPAKIMGLAWLTTGFLYGAWKTDWYRRPIEGFNVEVSEQTGG